ncbi:MAG: hypothetical protein FWC26_14720 [Fibromonadales bacterium]|nr:hypothetical protein [Fibromonadales bacterium]
MQTTSITKAKVAAANGPYNRIIDLGNGVQIPDNTDIPKGLDWWQR